MATAKMLQVSPDRRHQILEAAVKSFAECGFHQTTMQEVSARAGISVGLIYRYFNSKEEMIAALAAEHKKAMAAVLARAGNAPSLLEAMEILFTSHCATGSPKILAAFVVELFAEASRNPRVARAVRSVAQVKTAGVAALVARAPEMKSARVRLKPAEIAELIFAVNDGSMMRSLLQSPTSVTQQRERQLAAARNLWRLLFHPKISHANAH